MSGGRISGHVELRPIRLGLIIARESTEGLDRAVRFASICWGGQTFPIFFSDQDEQSIRRMATQLGVDAFVACDDDPRSRVLAELDGFSWLGYGNLSNLDKYGDRPVNLVTVLSGGRGTSSDELPALLEWDNNDDLALLLAILNGRVSRESDYERTVYDKLAESMRTVTVSSDGLSSPDFPIAGPLALGMWSVEYRFKHHDNGIVVIDSSSVSDLVKLWNIRAVGNKVLPWPEPLDERIVGYTRARLSSLPSTRWGQDGDQYITVFSKEQTIPVALSELLQSERRGETHVADFGPEPYVYQISPIGSQFDGYFEVDTLPSAGVGLSARIPLPQSGMVSQPDPRFGGQFSAARVTVHSEHGIDERVSFRAPGIRLLAKHLRWAMSIHSPVVRGVGDGVVVAYPTYVSQDLVLGAVDSVNLIIRLLQAAGVEASVSDAGRWSSRIIDMLGGASSVLAAQPAVREVLDRAAREGGANPEELHNIARRAGGKWEKHSLLWRRENPYHQWVVRVLAARRLIEAHLIYTCRACGLLQRMAPDEIQPMLTCNACDHETPLSLQVVNGTRWVLKTRSLLTQERLRSVFPIAASLLLFRLLESRADNNNLVYSLGLDLKHDGRKLEIDYAVLLHDDRGPALIIGEGKARSSFDDNDIATLEFVQDAVRALGVECFIAVSNSKTELTGEEIARLRSAADRFLFGLNEGLGTGGYINIPLVLTKNALTVPDLDDDHPLKQIGYHRSSVDELARWSAERELGLEDYGDLRTRTFTWLPRQVSTEGDSSKAGRQHP